MRFSRFSRKLRNSVESTKNNTIFRTDTIKIYTYFLKYDTNCGTIKSQILKLKWDSDLFVMILYTLLTVFQFFFFFNSRSFFSPDSI